MSLSSLLLRWVICYLWAIWANLPYISKLRTQRCCCCCCSWRQDLSSPPAWRSSSSSPLFHTHLNIGESFAKTESWVTQACSQEYRNTTHSLFTFFTPFLLSRVCILPSPSPSSLPPSHNWLINKSSVPDKLISLLSSCCRPPADFTHISYTCFCDASPPLFLCSTFHSSYSPSSFSPPSFTFLFVLAHLHLSSHSALLSPGFFLSVHSFPFPPLVPLSFPPLFLLCYQTTLFSHLAFLSLRLSSSFTSSDLSHFFHTRLERKCAHFIHLPRPSYLWLNISFTYPPSVRGNYIIPPPFSQQALLMDCVLNTTFMSLLKTAALKLLTSKHYTILQCCFQHRKKTSVFRYSIAFESRCDDVVIGLYIGWTKFFVRYYEILNCGNSIQINILIVQL